MCGIVGYVGQRQAVEVIMDGLQRLEYRGYDSAGIVVAAEQLTVVKRAGKLQRLREALVDISLEGQRGLGHTRWATHGKPNDSNAHPHCSGDIAIVHNGIIENYLPLRQRLCALGYTFSSETDSEVLAHLIAYHYAQQSQKNLHEAVRHALAEVQGAYALVVTHRAHEEIIAARLTSPLVLGLAAQEHFVASDVPALLPYTREVMFLNDGDIAAVRADGVEICDLQGQICSRPRSHIDWDAEAAEKAGYPHYMLKEIEEQSDVVRATLAGRIAENGRDVQLGLSLDPSRFTRVVITAAGTAYYAGMVAEYWLEQLARLPVEVEVASEFRYREPVLDAQTLCIVISQSGETIDSLEAMREAKRAGATVLAILNVKGSSISREADDVLYIHAGPEIGVASTKAYSAMLSALFLVSIWLARQREQLADAPAAELLQALQRLPEAITETLQSRAQVAAIAERFKGHSDYLFLGRGVNFPTALEGALKLKEISYIHAEAYATGEMKHGPIALIDSNMPVVVIATASRLYEKTLANIQEVKARDGIIIALVNPEDRQVVQHADYCLYVPASHELLSPMLNVIVLQLLAYETAVRLGLDVDQPRNLAKSVTVE